MYKDFYGFQTYPFAPTADAQFLYPSDTYKDCLACLLHGLQRGYSNSNFGDQLVSTCSWSSRPWIMKSIR
jgi:hypothetical protein